MSLFSFLRKKKQESAGDDGSYYSRTEEESQTARPRRRRSTAERRNDALDPVLPEKKRARRRLIGAVALVLAAVIGLPMILDSEPKPLADDIAIHIPSRDSLPPPLPARRSPPDNEKLEAESLDPREEVVAVPVAPAPAAPAPAAKAVPKAAPAAPAAPPASAAPAPVRPAPAQRSDDGARALALLEGRTDPAAGEKKAEKFVIQVAALASQEKVNELQGRLKSVGIQSYTQKVATEAGERTRVRVGPFVSREEAEKVRARIVKLGLNGTLVPA